MADTMSRDAFLGGRLMLLQPLRGYRAGVDPVLLASACTARPGDSVLELGCGVGTASLCLAARVPELTVTGVECQPDIADLARRNAADTGARMDVVTSDLTALPAALRQQSFDHVIANPPYFQRDASIRSTHAARETAMGEQTPLSAWLDVAARRLAPKGWLTMIHRAERLPDILAGLGPLGGVQIQPLSPRRNRDATLMLIRARKGGRSPMRLHAPVVLHEGDHHLRDAEDYTSEIRAVLRDGAAFPGFGIGGPI